MIVRGVLIAGLALLSACSPAPPRERAAPSLEGTWRVVSYTARATNDSGVTMPFGPTPRGYLVYTTTGRVLFQVLRPSAIDSIAHAVAQDAPPETFVVMRDVYDGYFGTYRVDTAAGRVTHRIEGEVPVRRGNTEVSLLYRVTADSLMLGADSVYGWRFVRVR